MKRVAARPLAPANRAMLRSILRVILGLILGTAIALGVWAPLAAAPTSQARFELTLLTMGPGRMVYSMWGHTALRVLDRQTGADLVFDFGRFRFDAWFVPRFLSGKPLYRLGVGRWSRTVAYYRKRGRSLYGQRLHVAPADAERLVRALARRALPGRNTYAYHPFTENCTTALRDRVDVLLGGALRRFSSQPIRPGQSYRAAVLDSARPHPLSAVGLALIMNGTTDRNMTHWEAMFRPLELMQRLEGLRAQGGPPAIRIGPPRMLLPAGSHQALRGEVGYAGLALVALAALCGFVILFLWPLFSRARRAHLLHRLALWIWSAGAGAVGLILIGLGVASAYRLFHANWNLLGFHPLLLVWPFLGAPHARIVGLTFACVAGLGALASLTGIIVQIAWPFLLASAILQCCLTLGIHRHNHLQP